MATLIQSLQFTLSQRDPLLANETKRIILKQALQAYVLDFLYNHPVYRRLNFYGGTCLHIVYGIPRCTEDLHLDNREAIPLSDLEKDLLKYFHQSVGYPDAVSIVAPSIPVIAALMCTTKCRGLVFRFYWGFRS